MTESTPADLDVDREAVIWLAGLLEGEGAFDAHRGKYPRVRVQMTDRDIIDRAGRLMGTTTRLSLREAPASPTWNAEVSGPRAEAVMTAVLPYMGARRSRRIAEVLAAAAYHRGHARKSLPGPSVAAALAA